MMGSWDSEALAIMSKGVGVVAFFWYCNLMLFLSGFLSLKDASVKMLNH
jgi:hypothetical protein